MRRVGHPVHLDRDRLAARIGSHRGHIGDDVPVPVAHSEALDAVGDAVAVGVAVSGERDVEEDLPGFSAFGRELEMVLVPVAGGEPDVRRNVAAPRSVVEVEVDGQRLHAVRRVDVHDVVGRRGETVRVPDSDLDRDRPETVVHALREAPVRRDVRLVVDRAAVLEAGPVDVHGRVVVAAAALPDLRVGVLHFDEPQDRDRHVDRRRVGLLGPGEENQPGEREREGERR